MKTIDTRDLVSRLEELIDMHNRIVELEDEIREWDLEDTEDNLLELDKLEQELDDLNYEYDREEHMEIENIESEVSEFHYGVTLILEDDFADYVKELLEDTGDITRDFPWYIDIDWETTASNIESDYTSIEYDGETYLFRN